MQQSAAQPVEGNDPAFPPRNRHKQRRVLAAQERLGYSIEDFSQRAGWGRTKTYLEIAAGRLKAKKQGSRTIITAKEADRYFDALPDLVGT